MTSKVFRIPTREEAKKEAEQKKALPHDILVKVAALWITENGNLSGPAGNARYLILRNKKKTEDSNEPDFNLFVASSYVPPEFKKNGSRVHPPSAT